MSGDGVPVGVDRARELLAAEYERTGKDHALAYARELRAGIGAPGIDPNDEVALRAIAAALAAQGGGT